jgi:hypothetical protein
MAFATHLFAQANKPATESRAPHIGLVRRTRIVRDFVLLITVCVSIGLAVGLGLMAAVFALL